MRSLLLIPCIIGATSLIQAAPLTRKIPTDGGMGADTSITRENPSTNEGTLPTFAIKSVAAIPDGTDLSSRKGYIRFDRAMAGQLPGTVTSATLNLVLAADQAATESLSIYGLNEDGMRRGSPLAEGWSETEINWLVAPANDLIAVDGDALILGEDPGRALFLGTVDIPANAKSGTAFSFTSPELVEFLNRDENDVTGFILTGSSHAGHVVTIASKEHATLQPPFLEITAETFETTPFRLEFIPPAPEFGFGPTLNWNSEPDRRYQVQFKKNLTQPWENAPNGLFTAEGFTLTYRDDAALAESSRFYQVVDVTPSPAPQDSQAVLMTGIDNTVNPVVATTQSHTDKELADFEEPSEAPGRLQADPASAPDVIIGIISAAADLGEDATLKQPIIGRVLEPFSPVSGLIDSILAGADELTGFSRLLDLNPSPGLNPEVLLPTLTSAPTTISDNVVAVARPITGYQEEVTTQTSFVQGNIDGLVADPSAESAESAIFAIGTESPLLIGPLVTALDNAGGDAYEAIVGEGETTLNDFVATPDPNIVTAYLLSLGEAAPEIPQAWGHGAPTAVAEIAVYLIVFSDPVFTLPAIQLIRPATQAAGKALVP